MFVMERGYNLSWDFGGDGWLPLGGTEFSVSWSLYNSLCLLPCFFFLYEFLTFCFF